MKSVRKCLAGLFLSLGLILLLPKICLGDAPTYRGKVVLIVDNTIDTDTNVSAKIERLIGDLTGDGWRVLRHDVNRGPQHPDDGITTNVTPYNLWAQTNALRIREIRALIKADYAAAPNDVKSVFLLGHIPVPYSGDSSFIDGGHYEGGQPADLFYGDPIGPYGLGAWTDLTVNDTNAPYPEFWNVPGDGKFDQSVTPSPLSVGVGRVDLFDMPTIWTNSIETNETMLIAQYLDKDHDFRCANFVVQRHSIVCTADENGNTNSCGKNFCLSSDPFETIFGTNITDSCGAPPNWPVGEDFLLGYAADCGGPFGGISFLGVEQYASENMQVVFMSIYGSFVGDWDEQDDLLRAVLANPYSPTNGRYGYGLTAVWDPSVGLDIASLTNRVLGATIGEALFVGFTGSVNYGLMGDPTLRMDPVQQPGSLIITANGSTRSLSWTASADTNVTGYNVYSAPTSGGPYILVNTNGPVTGTTYAATRPGTNSAPDNFYIVRAVETESNLVGTYTNMADGITTNVPGTLTPYLTIVSQPASQVGAVDTGDGDTNAVVFTVDAIGSDTLGNPNLAYQWYEGTNALSDNGHYQGANTSALLISGLQISDAGTYHVLVSNVTGTITSSNASLITITSPPVPVGDSYTIIRNTVTNLAVLANDSDPVVANSNLTVYLLSALANSNGFAITNAGTIAINPDQRTIHFIPAIGWLGPVTFTYTVSDGARSAQTNVTINVLPTPGATPPTVSPIGPQQLATNATITIPFTATDAITPSDDLIYTVTCSDSSMIQNTNFTFSGTGSNRVLEIKSGVQIVSAIVTVIVTDYDGLSTSVSFEINPVDVPILEATGLQADGFHFVIAGPTNASVEIKETSDFLTWTSLGEVTLTGESYNFVDSGAISVSQRFYAAVDQNGCSLNITGFYQVTLAANGGTTAVANQLNNPAGNTLEVLFPSVPIDTTVYFWDPVAQSDNPTVSYVKSHKTGIVGWDTPGVTLNPGQGVRMINPSNAPFTVTFVGDVPEGSQLNGNFATTIGQSTLVSSIIPLSGTLDSLGFPVTNGDQIEQLTNALPPLWNTTIYTNGAWNPSSPLIGLGQCFFVVSGSSASRSWTEDLLTCSPEVSITYPADGTIIVGPADIKLTATATSDAGISNVEFFDGATLMGLGTPAAGSYRLNWNNPSPGSYAITAHATDSNGITTISTPVNVTVYEQPGLGSESYTNGNFQFTISGSPGVSVNVEASTNLINWTLLGTITLNGGSSNYVDTAAGSFTQRFYLVQEDGGCSSNVIGFYQVILAPDGGTTAIANQLNNPAGNTLEVLFAGVPTNTVAYFWDTGTQTYNPTATYARNKNTGVVAWTPAGLTLDPGQGALMINPGSAYTVTFVGEVQAGSQVNTNFATTAGQLTLVSSIIPLSGTLDSLSFPVTNGDQVYQLTNPLPQWSTTIYSNGAWNPSSPVIGVGQSFWVQSGISSNRTWIENLSPCP